MAIKKNRLVCICNGVTEADILKILRKGAKDLNDIRQFTQASTSCGRCKGDIESIINHFLSTKKPDMQQNIKF
ncbi:MAG: (2Fe-2S)-binding protein [Prolixibacteraceae bacterium]